MTRQDRVRTVFDEWAKQGKDSGLEEGHLPAVLDTFEQWAWDGEDRFLDVGCGNGYAVRLAAQKSPQGYATGIDISPEMIDKARALSKQVPNCSFEVANLLDATLSPSSYTKIFSMETIYYLEDIPRAFEVLSQLLLPGGSFAVLLDFYRENSEVHHWPEKLDVPMTLLGETEYREIAQTSGFVDVALDRFRRPDKTGWEAEEGTLRIRGTR